MIGFVTLVYKIKWIETGIPFRWEIQRYIQSRLDRQRFETTISFNMPYRHFKSQDRVSTSVDISLSHSSVSCLKQRQRKIGWRNKKVTLVTSTDQKSRQRWRHYENLKWICMMGSYLYLKVIASFPILLKTIVLHGGNNTQWYISGMFWGL